MSAEWRVAKIEEIAAPYSTALATGPFGSAISSKYFVDSGVPVIRGSNLSADTSTRLIDADLVFVSHEKANEFQRSVAKRGDLVFTCWGTINQVGLIDSRSKFDSYIVSNKQMKLTIDPAKADHRFIYYVFSGPAKQNEILENGIGSSVPGFNLGQLKRHEILLPPVQEQVRIADFLEAFDDRITLLRETNATLEAIAQALFKSWFVDFDPVRAKAEGRQPEGMDATTAALFPDSFEESELGLVPKGWSIGSVGDLASQKKGSVNPLASPGVLYEHYSLPAFDSGQAPVFELGQEIKSNKTPLPEEAVLLSKLNPHIPRVWLPVSCGANAVCSTEFLAYSPRDGASKELIYCLFGSSEFQQQLCQLVTGTSNSHQRVKPDQVLAIKLPIAGKPALKAFTESVRPLFERVHANRLQAQTLTQLRDTLLPRLISGQLRLLEAQALLNDRDIVQ